MRFLIRNKRRNERERGKINDFWVDVNISVTRLNAAIDSSMRRYLTTTTTTKTEQLQR